MKLPKEGADGLPKHGYLANFLKSGLITLFYFVHIASCG